MTQKTTNGFTLVELLVIVSLIALLVGILLPVLGVARGSARAVECLSNLRQMSTAASAYTTNHHGVFPLAYYFPGGGDSLSWEINTIAGVHSPGILWDGQGVTQINQCPSYDGPDNWSSSPYSGYNYNTSFIGHGQFEAIPEPAHIAQLRNPTQCPLFGDGGYSAGANKFMRSPLPNPADHTGNATRTAGTQAFRHQHNTHTAYADGHAIAQSERFTAGLSVADGTGFLSDDNAAYALD